MPTRHLAYLPQIGERGIEDTFQRIIDWAVPKGLLGRENTHVCRVFHDSFRNTAAENVRMSIGILTDQVINADGEIRLATLEKGRSIVGHLTIEPREFESAWVSLFEWMQVHGYQKAAQDPYEIYHNNYNDHPEKKCIVDLFIPIH